MSKVKPLTESGKIAARWKDQDSAFYKQFERIRQLSGMTKGKMAEHLGLSVTTMAKYAQCPDEMPKKVERRLVLLAEKVGIEYDPALGDGIKKKENMKKELEALKARMTAIEKRMLLSDGMIA